MIIRITRGVGSPIDVTVGPGVWQGVKMQLRSKESDAPFLIVGNVAILRHTVILLELLEEDVVTQAQ